MFSEVPLALQTVYAELMERCEIAAFDNAFPEEGTFVSKMRRDRRYWYFQEAGTHKQRYVGPETDELLERIAAHKKARGEQQDRRMFVSTLVRSARLSRPPGQIGAVVEALANAGVFRLRGVLVGTVAYQTYAGMLGVRLPSAAVQTGDVDIAQFEEISIAVEDEAFPILEALRRVDPSFRAVPHIAKGKTTTFTSDVGLRVEFLTPNRGADTDTPARLQALGTDAQPLRFLDFLIHDPEHAVVLHGEGVYVLVPAPERYAIHKLIVARRRRPESGKIDKDLMQAQVLLDVLTKKRPFELRGVWQEAFDRGPKWRQYISEALSLIDPVIRDSFLKAVNVHRSIVPGLDLTFVDRKPRYDFDLEIVAFSGRAGGRRVDCAISLEALEDHFGAAGHERTNALKAFRSNRSVIESLAQAKYLNEPVEEVGSVLLATADVERLLSTTKVPT
ncbi:MAG: DUF1488 family protein [Kiloniellales bacterium]|nr:DUF1488 family protein [Kiloniellales bacterium]